MLNLSNTILPIRETRAGGNSIPSFKLRFLPPANSSIQIDIVLPYLYDLRMKPVTTIIPTPSMPKRAALVTLGALLFAANLNTFVYSADLFPGGFAGIALLILRSAEKFGGISIPYSAIYLTLNAFPVYISFRYIGKKFTIFSLVMILVSSALKDILPVFMITHDVLLCSIFGGLINGWAITFCLHADATSGGTDFIAIYFSERKGKNMWNVIFAGNCIVLAVAGLLFGWDRALYSIIFQFASTQALNVLYHRYQKSTLLIITEKPDELFEIIRANTNHAATRFEGTGCYKHATKTLLYTVVSSDEAAVLFKLIGKADPQAFINVLKTKELFGKFFTRPTD
ncbi:MAG: YitT family protein [Treponema sp.]